MKCLKSGLTLAIFLLASNLSIAGVCESTIKKGLDRDESTIEFLDDAKKSKAKADKELKRANPKPFYHCDKIESAMNSLIKAQHILKKARESYRTAYEVCEGTDKDQALTKIKQSNSNIEIQNLLITDYRSFLQNRCGQ